MKQRTHIFRSHEHDLLIGPIVSAGVGLDLSGENEIKSARIFQPQRILRKRSKRRHLCVHLQRRRAEKCETKEVVEEEEEEVLACRWGHCGKYPYERKREREREREKEREHVLIHTCKTVVSLYTLKEL